jgi:hypothetical protein
VEYFFDEFLSLTALNEGTVTRASGGELATVDRDQHGLPVRVTSLSFHTGRTYFRAVKADRFAHGRWTTRIPRHTAVERGLVGRQSRFEGVAWYHLVGDDGGRIGISIRVSRDFHMDRHPRRDGGCTGHSSRTIWSDIRRNFCCGRVWVSLVGPSLHAS